MVKWLGNRQPEEGSRDDRAGDHAARLQEAHNHTLPTLDKRAAKGDATAAKAAKNIREKGGRYDGARNDGQGRA